MTSLLFPDDDPPGGIQDVRGQALDLDTVVGDLVRFHRQTLVRQVIVEKENPLGSSQSARKANMMNSVD